MISIIRRILKMDEQGQVHAAEVEQLLDYEDGRVEETYVSSVIRCRGCLGLLEKLGDLRGGCAECGESLCVHCQLTCSVCRRSIGQSCAVGFPERALSVCRRCYAALEERLIRHDRMLDEKIAHEKAMTIISAEMKLLQLCQYEDGSLSQLIAQFLQARLAHKLSRLEQAMRQERDGEQRRLP